MPLLVAVIVMGGTFFGYTGADIAQTRMQKANEAQMHWLALKQAAINQVAQETLKGEIK